MRARVQTKWFNVVFAQSGPGPDGTRLVPSTGRDCSHRELLGGRSAGVCQSVKLSVVQSVSQSVSLPVRVGLLGKTATSGEVSGRSVGRSSQGLKSGQEESEQRGQLI